MRFSVGHVPDSLVAPSGSVSVAGTGSVTGSSSLVALALVFASAMRTAYPNRPGAKPSGPVLTLAWMRLFCALKLPDELRAGIAAWQAGFDDPALRVVPAENLHMTLVFLGSRDPGDVDAIAEAAFSRVDSPAPVVEIEPKPVGLPRGKRPGLFALEARSPQAETLQAQVVAGLAAAGLHEPEDRPFWPHLTVARVRPAKRGSRRPGVVERPPGPLPNTRSLFRPTHS